MKQQIQTIIFILLIIPLISISQTQQKPKVGLVLSGGGAKGIAHIGMLHTLDSLGIKPDYITGTSMGSIMGALYAIGYSADEIDKIIREGDWDYVLSDNVPLSDIETSKKHAYKRSLLHFNFSGNLMPKLPAGIVYGQHISEYFSKLTWRVADIDDFNKFEIPYKCVSADLISGKPYFFDNGDLSTAMRSSMSIPTVFSPMKIDTLLLVDGGVYRNFPVIDAKKMGADILIGSYTGFKQKVTMKEMSTLTSVLVRSSTFAGIKDIEEQEKMCDYYIKYDLHGLGAKDFKKGKEIIQYGKDAMANSPILDSLTKLSHKLKKYPKSKRIIIPERDSILIAGITTKGLSTVSNDYMISKSGLEIGSKISKEDMTIALNDMMGTLLFNKITYKLTKDNNLNNKDAFIIEFDVVEKARGQMNISLNYDNFFGPSISTGFIVRNLLLSGSSMGLGVSLSENPMAHFNYDMFFGKHKKIQLSVIADYEVLNTKSYFNFGEDLGLLNLGSQVSTFSEFTAKLAYNFNTNNQFGINYQYQIGTINYKDGADIAAEIANASEYGSSIDLYFNHNNFNKQFYPTKGYSLYFSARYGMPFTQNSTIIEYDETTSKNNYVDKTEHLGSFSQLELRYKHLIKLGNHISLQPSIYIGLSNNDVSNINHFMLGGYSRAERTNNINMIGAEPYTYAASNYAMFNLDLQYKIINNLYLTLLTNATSNLVYDLGSDDYIEHDSFSAGLLFGYYSPLGPIDVGLSVNNLGKSFWHINIGFPF